MRHEYDDEQIFESNKIAARTTGRDWISRFNLRDVRAILDALPDQQDDWQKCGFEDIREGDRVKVVDTHEAGDQTVYEGDVVQVSKGLVMTAHHQLRSVYNSKWYRIPAPVQHPDPAEHPVIIDEMGEPWFWAGLDDDYHSPTRPSTFRSPSDFTIWTPAKVVADND